MSSLNRDEINSKSKRTSKSWETLMESFTDDLWTQILLLLPIKPLLRFKSVSKSWCSIISSHQFAKSHLAMAPKDDNLLIVQLSCATSEEDDDGSFSLFHLDLGCPTKNLKFPYSQGEYLVLPQYSELIGSDCALPQYSELIGSDCGIVCVRVSVPFCAAAKTKFDIYLWNPATKHSKKLPLPNIIVHYVSCGYLGFGFDHIDLDFKVVRLVSCSCSLSCSRSRFVEVYSSRKNHWREIQLKSIDIPPYICFRLCINGFLIALRDESSMLTFDLNKEVFHCGIVLPEFSFHASYDDVYPKTCVTQFKDTIAYTVSVIDGKIHMWTLDDKECLFGGGVRASWTKVHKIDIGAPVDLDLVKVLFGNAQFLLIEKDDERILYDFDEKVITKISEYIYLESHGMFKYAKSLFSLVGFKRIKWPASTSSLLESSLEGLEGLSGSIADWRQRK